MRSGDGLVTEGEELAAASTRTRRHAVLVVHGIGEQVMTDTARSLANALCDESRGDRIYPGSERDPDGAKQRIYKINWRTGSRPSDYRAQATDVYEAYWAYRFRDTGWSHVTGWLLPLIRGRRKRIPKRLSGYRGSPDVLTASLILVAAAFVYGIWRSEPLGAWIREWYEVAATLAGGVLVTAGFVLRILRGAIARGLLIVGAVTTIFGWTVGETFERLGSSSWPAWVLWALGGGLMLGCLIAMFLDTVTLVRALAVAALGVAAALLGAATDSSSVSDAALAIGGSVAAPLLVAALSSAVLPSMGDAARYLRDHPDNEVESTAARKIVIDKLQRLHDEVDDWGRPKYERVTVIGHSLGSVIAYDALSHYWAKVNESLPFSATGCPRCDRRQRAILRLENSAHTLSTAAEDAVGAARRAYRSAQAALARELRAPSVCVSCPGSERPRARWIVSDFMTLGSPISSIDFLTEPKSRGEQTAVSNFRRKREDREYPACPPVPQTSAGRSPDLFWSPYPIRFPFTDINRIDMGLRYLHHAAVFAPTRWTNLYFENDLIGGPVSGLVGRGVLDIRLDTRRPTPFNFIAVYPHSYYWKRPNLASLNDPAAESLAIARKLVRRPAQRGLETLLDVPAGDQTGEALRASRNEWAGIDPATTDHLSRLQTDRDHEMETSDNAATWKRAEEQTRRMDGGLGDAYSQIISRIPRNSRNRARAHLTTSGLFVAPVTAVPERRLIKLEAIHGRYRTTIYDPYPHPLDAEPADLEWIGTAISHLCEEIDSA